MARNNAERQAAMANKNTDTHTEDNRATQGEIDGNGGSAPTTYETAPAPATAAEPAAKKSIVPAKYAGKYKNGGSDPVAEFIKAQCGEGDKFSFDSFFLLAQKNGISADQTNKYAGQIAEERQGAKGRARMTLGNTLRANARKNGKLIALDDTEVALSVPKAALGGAVAAAAAAKEASEQVSAAEGVTTEDGGTAQVVDGASEAVGTVEQVEDNGEGTTSSD